MLKYEAKCENCGRTYDSNNWDETGLCGSCEGNEDSILEDHVGESALDLDYRG